MKLFFTLSLFAILGSKAFAQSATSVANGNWMNPFTWNCSCIPLPGYNVTINHSVMLDTSFYIPSGGITVNNGASLTGNNSSRDIWLNGGSFINNGTTTVRNFLAQSGIFSNGGSFTAFAFSNFINFTNTGIIQNTDSIYNAAILINVGYILNIDSITNAGSFTNNGICTFHKFTNTNQCINNSYISLHYFTNFGTFNNTDSLLAQYSIWNIKNFTNQSSGYISIGNDFFNGDSVTHSSVFDNNGTVIVRDSWYNTDTIKGITGSFVVSDSSYNSGSMKQTFDFCDLSPPSSAPYIDFNLGTISSGITWCLNTGILENSGHFIYAYPNPAKNDLFFEDGLLHDFTVLIYNSIGSVVFRDKNILKADISHLESGIYVVIINSEERYLIQMIQIVN